MQKKFLKIGAGLAVFTLFFSVFALPHIAFATDPTAPSLVFCNQGQPDASGNFSANGGTNCGWTQLVMLAKNIINYCIYLAVPLAALSFAYAGFLILTAGGDASKVKAGRVVFEKVAIGLFWVLAAWLVIHTILVALLGSNASNYSLLN